MLIGPRGTSINPILNGIMSRLPQAQNCWTRRFGVTNFDCQIMVMLNYLALFGSEGTVIF